MKSHFLALTCLLATIVASAQDSKIQIGVEYGYLLGVHPQNLGSDISGAGAGINITETAITGSFGRGMSPGIFMDYYLTEHVAIGFSADYHFGCLINSGGGSLAGLGSLTSESRSQWLRIAPRLSFQMPVSDKFHLIARAGADFTPISNIRRTTKGTLDFELPGDIPFPLPGIDLSGEFTEDWRGRFGVGVQFQVGFGMKVSDLIDLNLSLDYRGYTFVAASSEVSDFQLGGFNLPGFQDPYDTQVNYVNELNATSNNEAYNDNVNRNQPREELAERFNASALGARISLVFKL
ncbi:MAG: hypothetical protein EA392_08725 [Cryomorphaceae bacterium]|nr:MAG: hypothetical protein EA392_08725 [Cryomorphaceae bacterium]